MPLLHVGVDAEVDVAANGHVVVPEHSNVWYTTEAGITALGTLLADLEGTLLA